VRLPVETETLRVLLHWKEAILVWLRSHAPECHCRAVLLLWG